MASPRLLSLAKEILLNAATLGIEEAGTRICGSGWPYVKKLLEPVVGELQHRFPTLFLAQGVEGAKVAEQAAGELARDGVLQEMLTRGFERLDKGQEEILRVLAAHDERLRAIGDSIDTGFLATGSQLEEMKRVLQAIQLQLDTAGAKPVPALSIDEIYRQANNYQRDAMKWISARDSETASQRLAQGRELALAGLEREPDNPRLLVALGFIEKAQAQVAMLSNQDQAAELLATAATCFAKAFQSDADNVSAMNGMANVYLYAKDYDRAIKLGLLIFEKDPAYGAAAFDLSLALEGKLEKSGPDPNLLRVLRQVYHRLELIMPLEPQTFPANYLAYVQQRAAVVEKMLGAAKGAGG